MKSQIPANGKQFATAVQERAAASGLLTYESAWVCQGV